MKKKNYVIAFIAGVAVTLFILPLLYALGVLSFDVVLNSLFGKDSILAIIFSLVLIIIILFLLVKYVNKKG
ncbi:hypothetical protein H7992_07950 [Sporosarcina sp. resist]|uniref:hypothetical protein n=1 Tax=Sporosarcina sp. resist TaxID=2762563 RepID=UPI00164D7751|nr:hypothetical protein [Sporosarcina sp. resist]QNK89577.1 hypothetical protein H7992_07950 [Sporosarcina sp. resist]